MTVKNWWRLCAIAGFGVLAVSYIIGTIPNVDVACGGSSELRPILAFEFARTPADIAALFGEDPCRSRLVRAMDTLNIIDVFAFIPLFVAFLVTGAMAVKEHGRTLALLAAIIAVIAGLCDQAEDQILFAITPNLPGTQAQLDWLFWFVHVKFAGLALAGMAIGWLAFRDSLFGKGVGAMMIVGGLVSLFGLTGSDWWPLASLGLVLAWVPLWAYAIWSGFIRKAAA